MHVIKKRKKEKEKEIFDRNIVCLTSFQLGDDHVLRPGTSIVDGEGSDVGDRGRT